MYNYHQSSNELKYIISTPSSEVRKEERMCCMQNGLAVYINYRTKINPSPNACILYNNLVIENATF